MYNPTTQRRLRPLFVTLLCVLALPAFGWKMEAGQISTASTSGLSSLEQHTFQQIYDTPPIVVALATTQGGDTSALRIANVTTTGFRMSPVEPDSEDGPHASMTVSYFAIEPGVHTLPNGEVIEAGNIDTAEIQFNGNPPGRKGWESLSFSTSHTSPILIADIQTLNNETATIPRQPSIPWLTVAVRNISGTGAEIALERSEEFDRLTGSNYQFDALGSSETIGYVVMSRNILANFRANGNQLVNLESLYSSNAADGWSNGCDSVNFSGSYSATPLVVATKSTHNENDGGWLRQCSVNSSRIELTVDEDTAQDNERSHGFEDASLLVFSNSFFYDSNASAGATSDHLLLEADRASLLPDRFTRIDFKQIYDAPPAVFLLEDDDNPEPTSVRIRNITQSGFDVVPVEPDSRVADASDQATDIHYLAITRGEFQFPDGTRIEVGPLFPPQEISNYQSKLLSGDSWFNFGFATPFASTPALLSQILSMNNENSHTPGTPSQPWMTTAVRNVDTNGGELALDRAETNTGTLSSAEQYAYLAVETGTISAFQDVDGSAVASEAQRTNDDVRGTTSCDTYNFLQTYSGNPLVIGSQMTWDGGDGGWLRRCSASTSRVELKIEEDWAQDTDRSHTTERAGFMVFNDAFRADFSLVANYQLEGPIWTGSAGEVTDSSNTGANGQRYGDANPRPAQVCYGAELDGNGDYIEIPDHSELDIDEELTVMAWVRADAFPASDLKTIVSKDTNYEFHVDTSGLIYWWWNTDSGSTRSLTSATPLTAGVWHHVAIVYSRSAGEQKIYIDGIERGSQTYTGESLANNNLPLYIGSDYSYRSRDFQGAIDEVKIFKRALPAAAISLYANDSRACASCPLDSFQITQATFGLACPDTPAAVNVVALCPDGSTKTDYVGTVDLSGPSGSAFFSDSGGTNSISSLSYVTADNGNQTAYLYFNDENSNVQVTATDTAASVASTAVTGTDFRAFGFRVSQQPGNFICAESSSMTLQAYGQTDNNAGGACEVVEGFAGVKNMDAWFTATVDDDNTADAVSTAINVDGTPVITQTSSANNNLQLTFNNGESQFNLGYANSARILALNFRHDDTPYDGSQFSALAASTQAFVVRPDTFALSAQDGATNLNGNSSSSTTTHPAGADFELSINAQCSDGSAASDYAPNASSNTLMAYLQRTGPTGGGSVDGDMRISASRTLTSNTASTPVWESANLSPAAFNLGSYKYAGSRYTEVGLTRLHLMDQDYFGEQIPATTLNIGRFVPDYFEISTTNGVLAPFCSPGTAPDFSYIGQSIGYSTVPTIVINARNRSAQTTRNYTESGYQKLIPFDISRAFPTADSSRLGSDGATLLAVNSVAALPAGFTTAANGILTFSFDSGDTFTYTRDNNAQIAPVTTDIQVSITGVVDSDGVSANAAPYVISPSPVELRYGRWVMENAFGPETSPLAVPMRTEYFDGTRFQTNLSDQCTTYQASNLSMTPSLSGGSSAATGSGTLTSGESVAGSRISLSAPGSGNVGNIDLEYQGDSWLQYDWDNNPATPDTHPTASASFGQFRGHDRIIYWREVEN